ncbi:MAG: hypothetical protein V3T96_01485 [Thermodesulfobacteriota bacterium]
MIVDIFKKAALMGIGMMSLTEDKARELIEEMEKRGEVSSKEGRELIDKLFSKVDEERKTAEEKLKSALKNYLSKMNIATKQEVLRLEKKIRSLEKKITELTKK